MVVSLRVRSTPRRRLVLVAQLVAGMGEDLVGGGKPRGEALDLHVERGEIGLVGRALGIELGFEPLAQHLLGHELGLELGGALAGGLELGLQLAIAVGQAGEAVILLLGHLLQALDLVVEEAVALAGLDQFALGAGDRLVGLLRFEAQGLVFFRDVAGAFGLDRELVFQVGDDRFLVLHVQAQVLDRRIPARGAWTSALRSWDTVAERSSVVRAWALARSPSSRRSALVVSVSCRSTASVSRRRDWSCG